MFAKDLRDHDDTPVEDEIVVLHGLSWSDYQRQLELRGDRSVPRFAYLEGAVEITTPSRPHQSLKSRIGCLVEAWLLEKGIEFSTFGSWTREKKEAERLHGSAIERGSLSTGGNQRGVARHRSRPVVQLPRPPDDQPGHPRVPRCPRAEQPLT